jgi:hypothetical protein
MPEVTDGSASRGAWLLAALVPLLVVPAGFASVEAGHGAGATRVMMPVVAGLGLFPVAFAFRRGGAMLGAAVVAATCGGSVLAAAASRTPADHAALVACILGAFTVLSGLVAPILALGWQATAAVAWLATAAAACGLVVLVPAGAIPQELLVYNPLVRTMKHGLGYNWLHAANMYPRPGGLPYGALEPGDGVLVSGIVAASGLVIAGIIAWARRARPGSP